MTPNNTSAALAMLASTGRPIATSESFMARSLSSGRYLCEARPRPPTPPQAHPAPARVAPKGNADAARSEERRVGKEGRARGARDHEVKKGIKMRVGCDGSVSD